jgi:integrase
MVEKLRRSKTDQEAQGATKGIPFGSYPRHLSGTCAACVARYRWPRRRPALPAGYPAREDSASQALSLCGGVGSETCSAGGLDPAQFAGHSLRAGLATAAAAAGMSERAIMNQTGHHAIVVARPYIREGSLFQENAAGSVGL